MNEHNEPENGGDPRGEHGEGDADEGGGPGEEMTVWTENLREDEASDDLVVWNDVEGPDAADVPDPADGEQPEAPDVEPTDPEAVRSEVLADVKEYFRTADHDEEFVAPPDDAFVEERWFDFGYLEEFDEIERRWVNEPYAYVSVLYNDERKEFRYQVTEPVLDGFEGYVREDLTRILRDSLMYQDLEEDRDRARLFEEEAKSIIDEHAATVESGTLYKLLYYLTRDFVDYGKIDPTMRDPAIEDISCDGVEVPVFIYHREYRDLKTNVTFSKAALDSFTVRLAQRAGKSISVSAPLVDASLPDGSRIQLTLGGEISTRGSNFTIRKFADVPYTPVDLIRWNTFSVEQMAYFWLAIENNKSLIFAGGTGSGKTTSLNAVSFFVPPNSKVVSIEDTREITLPHDNWVQSVTRTAITEGGRGEVSMYELLQASLRQRPEYILVGEIRTEARVALTFFQAIGTGHTAYTTIHADSIEGVMARLQNEPLSIPAQMIKNLDIVSIQRQIRLGEARVRRNQAVVELLPGGDGEAVEAQSVFKRDPRTDTHEWVEEVDSHVLAEIIEDRGWDEERLTEELSVRRELLQYLVDEEITDYQQVTGILHTFAKDPDYVVERMRAGELSEADVDLPDEPEADRPEDPTGTVEGGDLPDDLDAVTGVGAETAVEDGSGADDDSGVADGGSSDPAADERAEDPPATDPDVPEAAEEQGSAGPEEGR